MTADTLTVGYPAPAEGNPPGPSPVQARAHEYAHWVDEVLFGGAAGGGKTQWIIAEVLRTLHQFPGAAGAIFRNSFTELEQSGGIIERLYEQVPTQLGAYNAANHTWNFANGSRLDLRYLERDADVRKFQGAEYLVVAWDQIEHHSEYQMRYLQSRLRIGSTLEAAGARPRTIASANPGGSGHGWVKRRWITPMAPNTVWQPAPTLDNPSPGTRLFIPSRVTDNPHIDKGYISRLRSLPPDTRRALLEGDWDVYSGQRFAQFRKERHHHDGLKSWVTGHVIEPGQLPIPHGGAPKAMGVDYGSAAPFAALWGAVFTDGLIVVYRELYQSGLTPSQQAKLILSSEASGERGPGRPIPVYIDPSTYARSAGQPTAQATGDVPPPGSIASHYRSAGLPVRRANNQRIAGWAAIDEALTYRPDGLPRLLIYDTCVNLIRTLPELPRSPHDPEDVGNGEDHAPDALRYLVMGLMGKGRVTKPPAAAPSAEKTLTGGLRKAGFHHAGFERREGNGCSRFASAPRPQCWP